MQASVSEPELRWDILYVCIMASFSPVGRMSEENKDRVRQQTIDHDFIFFFRKLRNEREIEWVNKPKRLLVCNPDFELCFVIVPSIAKFIHLLFKNLKMVIAIEPV